MLACSLYTLPALLVPCYILGMGLEGRTSHNIKLEQQTQRWRVIDDIGALSASERTELDRMSQEARQAVGVATVENLSVFNPKKMLHMRRLRQDIRRNPRHDIPSTTVTFVLTNPNNNSLRGLATVSVRSGQHLVESLYIHPDNRNLLTLPSLLRSLASYAKAHDPLWQEAPLIFDRAEHARPLLTDEQIATFGGTSGPLIDPGLGGEGGRTALIRTIIPNWISTFSFRKKNLERPQN